MGTVVQILTGWSLVEESINAQENVGNSFAQRDASQGTQMQIVCVLTYERQNLARGSGGHLLTKACGLTGIAIHTPFG